jgi:glycyl-tRNA synthetase
MEMQYFVKPDEASDILLEWRDKRLNYYYKLGIRPEKLRLHQHTKEELAHYAADAYDIEYEFPFGWQELEGIHNRTNFDLTRHMEFSGKDLQYFDADTKEKFIPYIIETSAGLNRTLLTCLVDAYGEDTQDGEPRTFLSLSPALAPVKVGVFSLVKKDGLREIADNIANDLRQIGTVFADHTGSIGKRYRRMDEIGTPWGITVDYQTKEDNTVTLRDRDTLEQTRVSADQLKKMISEKLLASS